MVPPHWGRLARHPPLPESNLLFMLVLAAGWAGWAGAAPQVHTLAELGPGRRDTGGKLS